MPNISMNKDAHKFAPVMLNVGLSGCVVTLFHYIPLHAIKGKKEVRNNG